MIPLSAFDRDDVPSIALPPALFLSSALAASTRAVARSTTAGSGTPPSLPAAWPRPEFLRSAAAAARAAAVSWASPPARRLSVLLLSCSADEETLCWNHSCSSSRRPCTVAAAAHGVAAPSHAYAARRPRRAASCGAAMFSKNQSWNSSDFCSNQARKSGLVQRAAPAAATMGVSDRRTCGR